ncbi:hypothetical protein CPB86DRAFT_817223 [Serendipita vermifera]|nr:hypothetical protein CPB86DRAFT_817223 [Serendipita vermifera]
MARAKKIDGLLPLIVQNFRIARYIKSIRDYSEAVLKDPSDQGNSLVLVNRFIERKLTDTDDAPQETEALRQSIGAHWPGAVQEIGCAAIDSQESEWASVSARLACTVLILKSTINLEFLFIRLDCTVEWLDALRSCPGQPLIHGTRPSERFLPRLRDLEWDGSLHEPRLERNLFSQFLFFMLLPALHRISIMHSNKLELLCLSDTSLVGKYTGQSNVQRISIRTRLSYHFIKSLLRLPRGLQHFRWEESPLLGPNEEHMEEPPSCILPSLLRSPRSLKKLALCNRYRITSINKTFYVLPSFSNLEELSVDAPTLLGEDLGQKRILSNSLPRSLRGLSLYGPASAPWLPLPWSDSDYLEALIFGLKNIRSRCPRIQRIVCRDCFFSQESYDSFRVAIADPAIRDILVHDIED